MLVAFLLVAWTRLIAADERLLFTRAVRTRVLRRPPVVGDAA